MDVSVSPRLTKKKQEVTEFAQKLLANKLIQGIDRLGMITPVDTGAYAESMTLNQYGNASGPSVSSSRRQKGVSIGPVIEAMEDKLYADLQTLDLEQGATFVNNAPHADKVEERHAVFAQLENVLRG